MRQFHLTILALAGALLVFAQLDSNTVTIQASRSVNLTPDQIVFSVSVSAGPNTSLDQIVAALSNSGITAANFVGVSGGTEHQSPLQWLFTQAAPLGKIKATIASFAALQQSIGNNNSGMSLAFQVQNTQISPGAIQSQACSMADLVADAQAQAQNVAAAAGLAIGPIIAISDGSSSAAVPTLAARVGDFSIGRWYDTTSWGIPTPPRCYLEVKFQLLRYQ